MSEAAQSCCDSRASTRKQCSKRNGGPPHPNAKSLERAVSLSFVESTVEEGVEVQPTRERAQGAEHSSRGTMFGSEKTPLKSSTVGARVLLSSAQRDVSRRTDS